MSEVSETKANKLSVVDIQAIYSILSNKSLDISNDEIEWILAKYKYISDKLRIELSSNNKLFFNSYISIDKQCYIVLAKTSRYICLVGMSKEKTISKINVFSLQNPQANKTEVIPDEILKDKETLEGYKLLNNDRGKIVPHNYSYISDNIHEKDYEFINSIDNLGNIFIYLEPQDKNKFLFPVNVNDNIVNIAKHKIGKSYIEYSRIQRINYLLTSSYLSISCPRGHGISNKEYHLMLRRYISNPDIDKLKVYFLYLSTTISNYHVDINSVPNDFLITRHNPNTDNCIKTNDHIFNNHLKLLFANLHDVNSKYLIVKEIVITIKNRLENGELRDLSFSFRACRIQNKEYFIVPEYSYIYNYIDHGRNYEILQNNNVILFDNEIVYETYLKLNDKIAFFRYFIANYNNFAGNIYNIDGSFAFITIDIVNAYIRLRRPEITTLSNKSSASSLEKSFHKCLDHMAETGKPFDFYPRFGGVPISFHPDKIQFGDQVLSCTAIPITLPYPLLSSIYNKVDKGFHNQCGIPDTGNTSFDNILKLFNIPKAVSAIPMFMPNRTIISKPKLEHVETALSVLYGNNFDLPISDNIASLIKVNGHIGSDNFSVNISMHNPMHFDFQYLKSIMLDRLYGLISEIANNRPKYTETHTAVLADLVIGTIKIRVSYTISKDTIRFNVNDFCIKRDEVVLVLSNALCFDNQNEYDNFLKITSQISLGARNLINDGLRLSVNMVDAVSDVVLEFDRSESRKWYLILRAENGKIIAKRQLESGISKFLSLFNSSNYKLGIQFKNSMPIDIGHFTNLLSSVKDLNLADLRHILVLGRQIVNVKLAKSRKLLADVVRLTKAEFIVDKITGYVVKGKSGRQYMVACKHELKDSDGDKPYANDHGDNSHGATYTYPDMKYLCIVDKSKDQAGYDQIASRLLALSTDVQIARDVTTLLL